ncbi:cysteine--tRNA ligase [Patescibacteria group bacterium]|nr:cysteine--tRNA ligase [Patescibacteria group bacterium]
MFGSLFKAATAPAPAPHVRFYNTLSGKIEDFVPLTPPTVTMYSCGPTVYGHAHIGNLRSYVFADILRRTLINAGYDVKHTINLTDFGHLTDDADAGEDKMMKGLKREGLPITLTAMRELSDRYIIAFKDDVDALRILPPTTWARASDYVDVQIRLIETLDGKGYTYETSDGVYFDISKFPTYGRLGNINLDRLRSGARVEINSEKRHPADFAVWKKGLLGWDSRWGKGFPGWHIECSAMAIATLGKQIDIHTGGIDHVHTHHNAERAQSEAATGKEFAHFWMHNEFITIDNTKISKSLGNDLTLRHLVENGFSADDYRYWLLTAHYRSPVNFSFEALKGAKQALYRLKRHMYEEYRGVKPTLNDTLLNRFTAHLANDLDTPGALALAWEVVKDSSLSLGSKYGTLLAMDSLLDLGLGDDPDKGARSLGIIAKDELPEDVQLLVDNREIARIARNWPQADYLREALNLKGYTVEDTPHGPKVTKAVS